MEALLAAFVSSLASQGPLVLALAVAIYYLKRSDDKKAEANEKLIALMNQERVERIEILETHVVECNQRHDEARKKYEDLLMRVANLDRKAA